MGDYQNCVIDANSKCMKSTVALLNANAAQLPCFDGALSEDECVDLYTFSLFSGKVDDRTLLKQMFGQQKDIFKVLLERSRSVYSNVPLAS